LRRQGPSRGDWRPEAGPSDPAGADVVWQAHQRALDHLPWRWQIYYAHIFEHPQYGTYVGAKRQGTLEDSLRLRA
jgi:hypothetical protein